MSTTYREKLLDIRWLMKRADILIRDGWACRYCFVKHSYRDPVVNLEVHHFEYSEFSLNPWDVPDEELITLCSKCHALVMKSHDRERAVTGQREKARMERRRELQQFQNPQEIASFMEQQRENEAQERLRLANICTCPECQTNAKGAELPVVSAAHSEEKS